MLWIKTEVGVVANTLDREGLSESDIWVGTWLKRNSQPCKESGGECSRDRT